MIGQRENEFLRISLSSTSQFLPERVKFPSASPSTVTFSNYIFSRSSCAAFPIRSFRSSRRDRAPADAFFSFGPAIGPRKGIRTLLLRAPAMGSPLKPILRNEMFAITERNAKIFENNSRSWQLLPPLSSNARTFLRTSFLTRQWGAPGPLKFHRRSRCSSPKRRSRRKRPSLIGQRGRKMFAASL